MPIVKELVRKRLRPKITLAKIEKTIKLMLLIVFFSILTGWFVIMISEYLNPPVKSLKAFSGPKTGAKSAADDYKDKMIDEYKEKYGDNWKTKIMEDYKDFIK